MSYEDREEKIMRLLKLKPGVSNRDLSSMMYVSEATMRRDLAKLEEKGWIIRMHGASLPSAPFAFGSIPEGLLSTISSPEYYRIGEKASSFVRNGDVVIMDGSDLALAIVPFLAQKRDVLVVTNGARTAYFLALLGVQTVSTGGRLVLPSFSLVGKEALHTLQNYTAAVSFFSSSSLGREGDLFDDSFETAEVKAEMIKKSQKRICLFEKDASTREAPHLFANVSEIDEMITGRW